VGGLDLGTGGSEVRVGPAGRRQGRGGVGPCGPGLGTGRRGVTARGCRLRARGVGLGPRVVRGREGGRRQGRAVVGGRVGLSAVVPGIRAVLCVALPHLGVAAGELVLHLGLEVGQEGPDTPALAALGGGVPWDATGLDRRVERARVVFGRHGRERYRHPRSGRAVRLPRCS
jgi:hypothetical protein